jgi:hypothetical protein
MRRCVLLWDLVRAGNLSLAKHVKFRTDGDNAGALYFEPGDPDVATPLTKPIVLTGNSEGFLKGQKPTDLRVPALNYLRDSINEHLKNVIQPRACLDSNDDLSLHFVPSNLLSGLWLQFAQAVTNGKDYARCLECQMWFEVTLHSEGKTRGRKTRMYCSNACRMRAYLGRKENAARLKKRGKSIAEIARQLGSDTDTVNGWMKSSEKSGGAKRRT